LTESLVPNLVVLAHNEIAPNAAVKALGVVRLADAGQETAEARNWAAS
jgi:hypothetical protein